MVFRSQVDIKGVAAVFYSYSVNLLTKRRIPPLLSRRLETFTGKLASMMEDFATLACLGELRHAGERITTHNVDLYFRRDGTFNYIQMSEYRWRFIKDYIYDLSKRSILCTAIDLFDTYEWEDGYGGQSWRQVAEITLRHLEGEITDIGYIDRMFHVTHNGGVLFDKKILFGGDGDTFREWLTKRQDGELDDFLINRIHGICQINADVINEVIDYDPIAWGSGELEYEAYEKDNLIEDEWGDEESYDEEMEEEEQQEEEQSERGEISERFISQSGI